MSPNPKKPKIGPRWLSRNRPLTGDPVFVSVSQLGSAAIDRDFAPGDVGGIFGSKEGHDFRDFFWASEPLDRNLRFESFADLLHRFHRQAEFAEQRSLDHAREIRPNDPELPGKFRNEVTKHVAGRREPVQ